MGKRIIQRQPDGAVIYQAENHMDVPNLDLLTFLLDSKHTEARPESVISADAADSRKCVTAAECVSLSRQLAYTLRHTYGVGRNGPNKDDVLVVTTGHYMLPILFYGTVAAGGFYSAASPGSTPDELVYLAGLVEPKVIICNADTKAAVEAAVKKVKFPLDRLLLLGDDDGPGLSLTVASSAGKKRLELSASRSLDWARITDPKQLEDSIICVLFSSGTTGLPKGVKLSHRMMVAETFLTLEPDKAWAAREWPGVAYHTLAHVPAAHIAGVQSYFVNGPYRGGTTYWMPKFDFPKFLEYLQKHKITFFFSVPPIWLAIARHPAVTDQLATVVAATSGAAPLGAQTQLSAEAKLGKGRTKLTQVWGLTETTGAITAMEPGEGEYTGSVSPLIANHEARIVDDQGRDVEPGGTGEVWVRGPVVTKGYWKNDKANRESFVNGWFCTGDIGHFKENGMLYIVDRKKELIKYKGLQVAPAELEELLLSNPKIADVAVIGVEGEGTEVPRAYVVPSVKDLTSEEVANWVAERAAQYKKLRGGVVFVDAIPKSPSGKILRKVLREQAKKEKTTSKL